LFDAHNHVQDERLWERRREVLDRARAAGVTGMVCCGTCEADWESVLALAAEWPDLVIPALGVHPWEAAACGSGWMERLEALATRYHTVIGEAGLDHAQAPETFPAQEGVFLAQLALSRRIGRPIVLHGRRAWGRLVELLEAGGSHPAGIVLHAYSGGAELVARLLPLGAWFSFSATVGYSGNRRAHRALQAVPRDRLLLETDAPDMLPHALCQGPREQWPPNEPANLLYTVEAAARILGCVPAELADLTAANASRVFTSLA